MRFLLFLYLVTLQFVTSLEFTKIFNGRPASLINLPFMVKLEVHTRGALTTCAGTYVSEFWILTAAHCVEKKDIRNVICCMGTEYAASGSCKIKRRVAKILIPTESKYHDIAMLQIGTAFGLCSKIRYAKLPEGQVDLSKMAQATCVAAGWGKMDNRRRSDELLEANVVLQPKCSNAMNLCVEATKQGPCQGDSGSPLVCNGTVIGVLSAGGTANCGIPTTTKYMRIDYYKDFIDKVISSKSKSYGGCAMLRVNRILIFALILVKFLYNLFYK